MEGVTVEWPKGALLDGPTSAGDSLAELLVEGEPFKSELCRRAGGTLAAPEVASFLKISSEEVDMWRCQGKLLAVTLDQEFRYPACKFVADGLAPGVVEILEIMGAEAWTALEFMITPVPDLEG